MDMGMSPTSAVTSLIRNAMTVADGEVPDLDELRDTIEEAQANADRYGNGDPEAIAELWTVRLTSLDPRRPARDMLEDLLSGIRGCWLLYQEYGETTDDRDEDDDSVMSDNELDTVDDGDAAASHDELDDAIDTAFCHAVRLRAAADRHRLDL
jgi:hypothetical protein